MIRRDPWLGPILAAGAIDLAATAVFKASLDGNVPLDHPIRRHHPMSRHPQLKSGQFFDGRADLTRRQT